MKRLLSCIFAGVILISSGLTQFVIHICPEQGIMLSEANCNMHHSKLSCCEQTHQALKKTDDCCTEGYFFAVTPKFGSVAINNIHIPGFSIVDIYNYLASASFSNGNLVVYHNQDTGPPKRYNRALLNSTGLLTI